MQKKYKINKKRVLIVILLIIGVILGLFYLNTRKKLQVIEIKSEIKEYNYYLESNATKIYKEYYEELEEELSKNKINEKEYATLISKLFVIDYYTLKNKVTNKNIGGIQFIHTNLKDRFIDDSSKTVYKYVKSNLYGRRKQKLPEVKSVEVTKVEEIKYNHNDYKDDNAYQVVLKVKYKKDYNYPKKVKLSLIHENNKLVIVEIK